jgi:membrane protein involved in colicin uptake
MNDTTSDNSVQFSLKELARIEEERVREEDDRRSRARENAARERREAEARRKAEEEARIAAAEKAREQRAREEAAQKALVDARTRAEAEVARIQAEAKVRLEADNAARAHELAMLRVRTEQGRRGWIYGLGIALGVALCGGAAGAYSAVSRVGALEQEAERLRDGQLSLAREHERARETELSALDLRLATLLARPASKSAGDARTTAEAARSAVDPKAVDHARLRAFADAIDALQARIETIEKVASLDRRKDDLNAWATSQRKSEDSAVTVAAARAKAPGADDAAARAYESALDHWGAELLGASGKRGGGGGTSSGPRGPVGAPCDPNVGDPTCDLTGHRI